MSLVVFTALVGLLLAPGGINPIVGVIAILCIAVGAGASGALNMWYDADIDARDEPHRQPADPGRPRRRATTRWPSASCCSVFSVALLGLATNWLAAGLLAFTIFFYAVIYTMWLKRSTPQNIVIGGAAGAFPPMIGWAAVTGTVSLESCRPLPHHLPLDAAALLGARALQAGRLRRGRHPDAAQRRRRGGDQAPDPRLFGGPRRRDASCPRFIGFVGLALHRRRGGHRRRRSSVLAWRLFRTSDDVAMRRPARALFTYSLSYLFVIFLALLTDHVGRGWLGGSDDRAAHSATPRS